MKRKVYDRQFKIAAVKVALEDEVTGVTLPFLSYGGSSLLITLTEIGVVLNISRYSK